MPALMNIDKINKCSMMMTGCVVSVEGVDEEKSMMCSPDHVIIELIILKVVRFGESVCRKKKDKNKVKSDEGQIWRMAN